MNAKAMTKMLADLQSGIGMSTGIIVDQGNCSCSEKVKTSIILLVEEVNMYTSPS